MTKKFIWSIVSCLMVAALILASCAPAVVEEKEAKVVTKEPEKKAEEVEEVVEEKTKYGGILVTAWSREFTTFDRIDNVWTTRALQSFTHNCFIEGNWWVDREVCNFKFAYDYFLNEAGWRGMLCESWEQPDPMTIIFRLREGVRWQNIAPLNGREFVAEDVKLYFERLLTGPRLTKHVLQNIKEITCPDKYTVKFTLRVADYTSLQKIAFEKISAHELWEQYGDMRHWSTTIGTGAFILEDYVMGTSMRLTANPDYWEKDPQGNKLPYIDGVKLLIITDSATEIAALQTGKIDLHTGVPWRQKPAIATATPELLWDRHLDEGVWNIFPKNTKAPYSDLRVRQALQMAIDFQKLADTIHEPGAACIHTWPVGPHLTGIYIPLDELPEDLKKVKTYNPTEAKKLLADAGYPNGFEATLQYLATGRFSFAADAVEIIAKYWDDIGVTLHLEPVDSATNVTLRYPPFPYKDMMGTAGQDVGDPYNCLTEFFITGAVLNRSCWQDPTGYVDEMYAKIRVETDSEKRTPMYRELYQHILGQWTSIALPLGVHYFAWWPWVEGYTGEASINYTFLGIPRYVWLDQDLKKEITGR